MLCDKNNRKSLKNNFRKSNKENSNLRATATLVIICGLFLIAELPQSVLLFLSILNFDFYIDFYRPLGDLLDILVLFNYSISFLLYCYMSQNFRNAFYSLFKIL